MDQTVDILIIGGGINGSAIARDAAGRGLSVTLCEMHDLASATSSWSTKLIHGGLRYLENYEFKLVHEALNEREVLMHSAPFLIHPMKFILPYEQHLRAPWMLRLGLFLYDHLGKRTTIPGSKKEVFSQNAPANALNDSFKFGYSYYDCQTDDSRLTTLCARDAFEHGADILTYTKCTALSHDGKLWSATLKDQLANENFTIKARAVVNTTGPWVDIFDKSIAKLSTRSAISLVKGSHIVLPKLYEGNHAYILQNDDKRIVFAIPYLTQFTLIGTTDVSFQGNPAEVAISDDEIFYLCNIINSYFKQKISKNDIVWSYSGVRPLFNDDADNPSKTTREYHLELHHQATPPYLAVFGGKITTCRVLAEDALAKLKMFFPKMTGKWTSSAYLPGGDLGMNWQDFLKNLSHQFSWIPQPQLIRYAKAYGTNIHALIGNAKSLDELGVHFGHDLYEHEVLYWIENEFSQCTNDMIWRRSKLGLFLDHQETQILEKYMQPESEQ